MCLERVSELVCPPAGNAEAHAICEPCTRRLYNSSKNRLSCPECRPLVSFNRNDITFPVGLVVYPFTFFGFLKFFENEHQYGDTGSLYLHEGKNENKNKTAIFYQAKDEQIP